MVGIEVTTGWRWVSRELVRAWLRRLWLARLPARETLPEPSFRRRRYSVCVTGRGGRRWPRTARVVRSAEGWPCSKSRLLSAEGLLLAAALRLPEHARLHVDLLLAVMAALDAPATETGTPEAPAANGAAADARLITSAA